MTFVDDHGRVICGPFPVAGRASDALAVANGNPHRNPILRFGDTPTGNYLVRGTAKSGRATPFDTAQFGPHGVIVLDAVAGNAALAEASGRFHFLIVGGKLSSDGKLCSTAGSLRLNNEHMRKLVSVLRGLEHLRCDIVECDMPKTRRTVYVDPTCRLYDPPAFASSSVSRTTHTVRREVLRGGAASAMALGISVSFVAIQNPTPARASVQRAIHAPLGFRGAVEFVAPTLVPSHHYTRLAYGEPAATPDANDATPAPSGAAPSENESPAPSGTSPSENETPAAPGDNKGAAPATGALEQLENGTSGHQVTGDTFDNGTGPTDALPQPNNVEPPEPTLPPQIQPTEQALPEQPPPQAPPNQPPEPEQPTAETPPSPNQLAPSSGTTPSGTVYSAPAQSHTTYGPGDERMTPGGTNLIQGGGQPITGAGITQGAPDRAPSPNPTPSGPIYAPSPSTAPASRFMPTAPSRVEPQYVPAPSSPFVPQASPLESTQAPATVTTMPSGSADSSDSPAPRDRMTVIDIFPAGSAPKPGQKPPGK